MHSTSLSISELDGNRHTGNRHNGNSNAGGGMHNGKLTGVDIHPGTYHHSHSDHLHQETSPQTTFNGTWGVATKAIKDAWMFLRERTNITAWILVAVVIGVLVGKFAPEFAVKIGPLGTVFIRMIQCIVGPLIFSTLVVGIAGHGDNLVRIGRLAFKCVVYFEVVTTIALIIGLIAVNIAKPGAAFNLEGLTPPDPATIISNITWVTQMEAIVPTSFFLALNDHSAVLAVVFCAIMFSVAITQVDERSRGIMLDFNNSLSAIMFKVVELVMNYAPIGVGCAIASTVGQYGVKSLTGLLNLVVTLYVSLIIFVLVILIPIIIFCRFPLKEFVRAIGPPFLMAFATSSSESALPKAMDNMVAFGVPKDIVAFVIPTGCSFNLDGTTLYLAIAVIFCAQVAGIDKSVRDQVFICLSLMLTSKGVAAVPRTSFIVLASTLSSFGVPLESLMLVSSVDAFLDMARTGINVIGNMTASAVIAKWEGEFRNEDWVAQRSLLMPETLAMDEPDGDRDLERGTAELPLHRSHLSPGLGHTLPGASFAVEDHPQQLNTRMMNSEKASIHSIRSLV
ncbi:hypothetical protein BGZ65_000965 [Modicella reniformis]|uniref:Amino acid transporter n=1 Tax=Modicella reniformis TaxID=1440133 RepID=A0A9P6SUA7_9FUNG|nr:hypothetical protein BGZ65_000965 [Modicella reniformis]